MERIHTLIDKLYQQKTQGASSSHLLFTVQLLHQELASLQQNGGSISSVKVAVTLPGGSKFSGDEALAPFEQPYKPVEKKEQVIVQQMEANPKTTVAKPAETDYALQKPANPVYERNEHLDYNNRQQPQHGGHSYHNRAFEMDAEVPTLAQYSNRTEVHQAIASISAKESLNERLKQDTTEVAHLLKDAPVKDLRRAIGINERFTFVKELFRGDEPMYERSIKTINNFSIYSEAEYWITRELQSRLGWLENNEAVRLFYTLVKRRFA